MADLDANPNSALGFLLSIKMSGLWLGTDPSP